MRWIETRIVLLLVCALIAPTNGFAQPKAPAKASSPAANAPPSTTAPAASTATGGPGGSSGDQTYVLGVGDTIDVAIVGRTDFNTHARVGSDGAVLLPYLGAMPAINRTPARLADEIRLALEKGGYFSQPVVRVDVVGVASRFVTVLGSVSTPGLQPLDRQYHLSEIVARAGGRAATGVDYVILTHDTGKSERFKFSDFATGSGEKDPLVANGDKIYVPAAENQVFYLTGEVKTPGAYPISEGLTVRMALARAGGVTDSGNENKVKINRKGSEVKGVKLDATIVEPGDVLTVGERLF